MTTISKLKSSANCCTGITSYCILIQAYPKMYLLASIFSILSYVPCVHNHVTLNSFSGIKSLEMQRNDHSYHTIHRGAFAWIHESLTYFSCQHSHIIKIIFYVFSCEITSCIYLVFYSQYHQTIRPRHHLAFHIHQHTQLQLHSVLHIKHAWTQANRLFIDR